MTGRSELREALDAARVRPGELQEALAALQGDLADGLILTLDQAAADEPDRLRRSAVRKAATALRDVPRELLAEFIAKTAAEIILKMSGAG